MRRLRCSCLSVILGVFLSPASSVDARVVPTLDYRIQFDNSDFVVIATPLADTKDTDEHSVFQGIASMDSQQRTQPVESVGVETAFQVSVVLKGDVNVRSFTLHHYREASPVPSANGPMLVSFTSIGNSARPSHSYLMFLKREADGRFEPTGGQVDPAMIAVFPLRTDAGRIIHESRDEKQR